MPLKALTSNLGVLPSRLSVPRDPHGHSAAAEPWRAWYKLKAWLDLRVRVFVRDSYRCQMPGCGVVTGSPIADHVIPHRGDRALFFDDTNVQTLCKPCHDGRKQAEERRARG